MLDTVMGPGTPRTLPLRLSPLSGEPLDSWLEAYCRRLDVTTGVLLAALGIHPNIHGLPDHTVCLHPAEARRLASVASMEVARLHAMTLRVYDGHVLRVDQHSRGVARSAWWARTRGWKPVRYAAVGGPNQVVSASASPTWVRSPTQATYPSGRINTAVGAGTVPSAGSSHAPPYLASIN
jgi:hypothetical protein